MADLDKRGKDLSAVIYRADRDGATRERKGGKKGGGKERGRGSFRERKEGKKGDGARSDSLLLAKLGDFRTVPGLRVENRLD